MNKIVCEDELEVENSILKKIINAFHGFSSHQRTLDYEKKLSLILMEMENLKKSLNIPKQNGHYIDCVWSNTDCKCGPDTCVCCHRFWTPRYFTNKLIDTMGIDFILWTLEQN